MQTKRSGESAGDFFGRVAVGDISSDEYADISRSPDAAGQTMQIRLFGGPLLCGSVADVILSALTCDNVSIRITCRRH